MKRDFIVFFTSLKKQTVTFALTKNHKDYGYTDFIRH